MVQPRYMLEKPPRAPWPLVFINQEAVPALINAFGAVEGTVESVAVATRRSPWAALAAAAALGALLALLVRKPNR